jgi:UDP-GlcNAc:undecaprenyl-phosphate GlcNAc-1-phosphate transferase
MLFAYFGIIGLSLLITVNLVPLVMKLAIRFDFMDKPGPRKVHTKVTPYGGGLAIALGMLLTILAGVGIAMVQLKTSSISWFPESMSVYLTGIQAMIPKLLAVMTGAFAILVVGMADDRYKLSPWTRLTAEALIALIVTLQIGRLDLFLPDGTLADVVGVAATVAWIVVMTNTFNLLDHFDGVCSGVALMSAICLFGIAILTGQLFIAAILGAMIGAILGFFLFNFPPAKIFLGDGGSLFLGYIMSVCTVLFTFYEGGYTMYSYFVPLLVMAVPIFDTARVCLIRIREGRSIFDADKNHLAHRLSAMGLSPRRIVGVVLTLTLLSGLAAVLMYQVTNEWGALGLLIQVLIVFIIITFLERRDGEHGTH